MTRWDRFKLAIGWCNWYVVYPEGFNSRPMCKRTAKSYAKMFGGHIEPTLKPIWDLGLR